MFTPKIKFAAKEIFEGNGKLISVASKWVTEEIKFIPDGLKYEESAIFNIVIFNISSIDLEVGRKDLDRVLTPTAKQSSCERLKVLATTCRCLVGDAFIKQIAIPQFIESLLSLNISQNVIDTIMQKYPHLWVLQYVQASTLV